MKRTLPGGALLVIEGIDGAGKSTQVELVVAALKARGLDVIQTHEPTTLSRWGQLLRESARHGRVDPEEELELFLKDREVHVRELIRPALEAGKVVVSDRYFLSTVAYQGSRGFSVEHLLSLNESFAPRPDLAVVLDLDVGLAVDRLKRRGRTTAFEDVETLRRCREIYRQIDRPYVLLLDASRPIEEVRDAILFEFGRRLMDRWAQDPQLTYPKRLEAALRFHGVEC